MLQRSTTLVLIFLTFPLAIFSQEMRVEQGDIKKNSISLNVAGTTPALGFTYERVLSNKILVEFGVGIPSVGLGIKIYPFNFSNQKLMFHTGITSLLIAMGGDLYYRSFITYVPFGISYFFENNTHIGIDAGPAFGIDPDNGDRNTFPYGNFKVGFRF